MNRDEGKLSLIEAVDSLQKNVESSKSSLLDYYVGDLGILVDRGVPLGMILNGLEKVNVKVSKTLLRNYLIENFPAAYGENYTKRLIGGRASSNTKKESCQQNSSNEKKGSKVKKNMSDVKNPSKKESSNMVQDYLDQNSNK